MDLISHLPYRTNTNWHIAYDTPLIDYVASLPGSPPMFEPADENVPDNVISLTDGVLYGT